MSNNGQKPAEMEPIYARKTCYFARLQVGLHYKYKKHARGDQDRPKQSYGRSRKSQKHA